MNWIDTMESIVSTHADSVRRIRYQIEDDDEQDRRNNDALAVTQVDSDDEESVPENEARSAR